MEWQTYIAGLLLVLSFIYIFRKTLWPHFRKPLSGKDNGDCGPDCNCG